MMKNKFKRIFKKIITVAMNYKKKKKRVIMSGLKKQKMMMIITRIIWLRK
jgi:hypothetical protein